MSPRARFSALLAGAALVVGCTASDTKPDGGVAPHEAGLADASDVGVVCDVEAPTACDDDELGYDDIAPIIESRCLSCHDGTMDLWPLTNYGHVAAWFIEIRSTMLSCGMPPPDSGLTMPTEEREALLHWIRCGFPQ